MGTGRDDAQIHAHIRALAKRTAADDDLMLEMLRLGCWPAGAEERTDPRLRAWVRRQHRRPNE